MTITAKDYRNLRKSEVGRNSLNPRLSQMSTAQLRKMLGIQWADPELQRQRNNQIYSILNQRKMN